MENNIYKTREIGEGAALLTCKMHLIGIQRMGKTCIFVFANKGECTQISNDYFFGDLTVNAREYYEAYNRLKKRIFANR